MSNTTVAELAERVDQVKLFHLFAFFGGDMQRVANAAQVDRRIVEALAHDFMWLEKIKGQAALDSPDGLKIERENNRAANYIMARRLMDVINGIVLEASRVPEKWAEVHCIEERTIPGTSQTQKIFTAKPLHEIMKAAQVAQDMTYRALGDKIATQAHTTEASTADTTNLAIHIYAGLEKLGKAAKHVSEVIPIDADVRDHVVGPSVLTPAE